MTFANLLTTLLSALNLIMSIINGAAAYMLMPDHPIRAAISALVCICSLVCSITVWRLV
jgi:hypothetical protein